MAAEVACTKHVIGGYIFHIAIVPHSEIARCGYMAPETFTFPKRKKRVLPIGTVYRTRGWTKDGEAICVGCILKTPSHELEELGIFKPEERTP